MTPSTFTTAATTGATMMNEHRLGKAPSLVPHKRLPWVLLVLIDGQQNWCLFASYAEAESRLLGLPAVTDATIYLSEPKTWRL